MQPRTSRLRREHMDERDGEQSRGRREVLARVAHDVALGLPARQRQVDLQKDRRRRPDDGGRDSGRNRLHKASTQPDDQRPHQEVGHYVQQRKVSGVSGEDPPRSGGGQDHGARTEVAGEVGVQWRVDDDEGHGQWDRQTAAGHGVGEEEADDEHHESVDLRGAHGRQLAQDQAAAATPDGAHLPAARPQITGTRRHSQRAGREEEGRGRGREPPEERSDGEGPSCHPAQAGPLPRPQGQAQRPCSQPNDDHLHRRRRSSANAGTPATSSSAGKQDEQDDGRDRLQQDDGVGHEVGGPGELVASEREAGQVVPAPGADPGRGDGGRQADGGQDQPSDRDARVDTEVGRRPEPGGQGAQDDGAQDALASHELPDHRLQGGPAN